jgi:hypothetical protein
MLTAEEEINNDAVRRYASPYSAVAGALLRGRLGRLQAVAHRAAELQQKLGQPVDWRKEAKR